MRAYDEKHMIVAAEVVEGSKLGGGGGWRNVSR